MRIIGALEAATIFFVLFLLTFNPLCHCLHKKCVCYFFFFLKKYWMYSKKRGKKNLRWCRVFFTKRTATYFSQIYVKRSMDYPLFSTLPRHSPIHTNRTSEIKTRLNSYSLREFWLFTCHTEFCGRSLFFLFGFIVDVRLWVVELIALLR